MVKNNIKQKINFFLYIISIFVIFTKCGSSKFKSMDYINTKTNLLKTPNKVLEKNIKINNISTWKKLIFPIIFFLQPCSSHFLKINGIISVCKKTIFKLKK